MFAQFLSIVFSSIKLDKNLYNTEVKIDDQDLKIAFLVFIAFIISIFLLSSILTLDYLNFENSFKWSYWKRSINYRN